MGNIKTGALYAEIYVNGELIKKLPLSENAVFKSESEAGYNIIEVKDGAVSVTDADCADKVCVRTGAVSDGIIPIVCLPHRLEVKVTGL